MDDQAKIAERKRKKSEANKRAYERKKALKPTEPYTISDHAEVLKKIKTEAHDKGSAKTENPFKHDLRPLFQIPGRHYEEPNFDDRARHAEHLKKADSVFSRQLSVYLTAALILIFMSANAYFIISEQADFYQLTGYSREYSVFIALLTESATVLLSYFAVSKQKPILYLVLAPTVLVTFAIIFMGIQRKESSELRTKRVGQLMQSEINNLNEKIVNLKTNGKPSAIDEKTLAAKQKALAEWLKNPADIGEFETYAQAALRLLAVFWNVIFPGILAALWVPPQRLFPD